MAPSSQELEPPENPVRFTGVLAALRAADFLPEIWLPDADTERLRRLVARRNQIGPAPHAD
jgi:hypothetical protein